MVKAEVSSSEGEKISLSSIKLKYLFEVVYKDGTVFRQTKEDVSMTDPKRSAYFDINQDEVATFALYHNRIFGGQVILVNLIDGHFEIDGKVFFCHDKDLVLTNFRLIYFRRHKHNMTLGGVEIDHTVDFHVGWQANDEAGVNHQRVISPQS